MRKSHEKFVLFIKMESRTSESFDLIGFLTGLLFMSWWSWVFEAKTVHLRPKKQENAPKTQDITVGPLN